MSTTVEPGWYPDPEQPDTHARYWDGSAWTNKVRDRGAKAAPDPRTQASAAPAAPAASPAKPHPKSDAALMAAALGRLGLPEADEQHRPAPAPRAPAPTEAKPARAGSPAAEAPLTHARPRRRISLRRLFVLSLYPVALVATVGGLAWWNHKPAPSAEQVADTYMQSLYGGDGQAAYELICPERRARVSPFDFLDQSTKLAKAGFMPTRSGETTGGFTYSVPSQSGVARTVTVKVVEGDDGPQVCW